MYKNKRKGEGRGMREGEGGASLFPEETHWNKKKIYILFNVKRIGKQSSRF
jgi:hypothetical protein